MGFAVDFANTLSQGAMNTVNALDTRNYLREAAELRQRQEEERQAKEAAALQKEQETENNWNAFTGEYNSTDPYNITTDFTNRMANKHGVLTDARFAPIIKGVQSEQDYLRKQESEQEKRNQWQEQKNKEFEEMARRNQVLEAQAQEALDIQKDKLNRTPPPKQPKPEKPETPAQKKEQEKRDDWNALYKWVTANPSYTPDNAAELSLKFGKFKNRSAFYGAGAGGAGVISTVGNILTKNSATDYAAAIRHIKSEYERMYGGKGNAGTAGDTSTDNKKVDDMLGIE